MIVPGVLSRTGITVLPGASGAGKSTFLSHLFARLCRGLDVLGLPTLKTLTIHITNDDQESDFFKLVGGVVQENGINDGDPFAFRSLRTRPFAAQNGGAFDLTNPVHEAALLDYVQAKQRRHGPQQATVIALETLNTITPDGDDVNPRTIRAVQDAMKRISQACDAQFIITTHRPKNDLAEFSGHHSARSSADGMIVAKERKGSPSGSISLDVSKMRGDARGTQLHCRVVKRFYTNNKGETVAYGSIVWERAIPPKDAGTAPPNNGPHVAEDDPSAAGDAAGREMTASLSAARAAMFLSILQTAITERGSPLVLPGGTTVQAVPVDEVRRAFRDAAFPSAGAKPEAIKKAWKRAREAMTGEGKPARVSADGAHLWLVPLPT